MQPTLPTPRPNATPFAWACPRCRGDLALGDESARCAACGQSFARRDGIWQFLSEEDERRTAGCGRECGTVRAAEGWRRNGPADLRALTRGAADDPNRASGARR